MLPGSFSLHLVGRTVNRFFVVTLVCGLGGGLFLFLAVDGRLHWDEPAYLYTAGYLSYEQLTEGDFIGGLYLSRILHVLLIRAIVMVTGLGKDALVTLITLYFFCLLAFSYVSYLILRELLPRSDGLGFAVVVSSFTPIYLYFSFKTLPEIPALLLSTIAVLALMRSMQGQSGFWLTVIAVSLAATALFKNTMVLLYLSFVIALLMCRREDYPVRRVIRHALFSGLLSIVIFYVVLTALGIEFNGYFKVASVLAEKKEPVVSLVLNTLMEGGIFFLALPLACLPRHRSVYFFLVWFAGATLPLLLLFAHIESRYLASNLVALSGLVYLAIEGLKPHLHVLWCRSKLAATMVGGAALALLIASNMAILSVMSHEVRMDQLETMISELDLLYGASNYAILTPWPYTDFHYLRFVYPERAVYNVHTRGLHPRPFDKDRYQALEDRYYRGHMIRTVEDLASLKGNLIYLGFEENFSVANLRTIVRALPLVNLDDQFRKMKFLNHMSLSWMWRHPQVELSEQLRHGHYIAYCVKVHSSPPSAVTGLPAEGERK